MFSTNSEMALLKPIDAPRPSVQRCLFGKETASDKERFSLKMKELEESERERFKAKWNFDVLCEDSLNNNTVDSYQWVRANSDSDIPEFYRKGLRTPRKTTKPLVRCMGKALTFDSEDSSSEECKPVAVPFGVELFLGLRLPLESERITTTTTLTSPASSDCVSGGRTHTPPTLNDSKNVKPSVRRQLRMTGELKPLNALILS
jgi:hypothetical protein